MEYLYKPKRIVSVKVPCHVCGAELTRASAARLAACVTCKKKRKAAAAKEYWKRELASRKEKA